MVTTADLSPPPEPPRTDKVPVLEMRDISKTFPGVKALNKVRLSAYGGEVMALMGENGAGKSTLMKILSGAYTADPGGEVRINGKTATMGSPLAAREAGIAIIYQELALAPNLTVAENIHLGNELRKGGMIDRSGMARACAPLLERLGVPFRPETIVGTLSVAEQQLVEIARALYRRSKILVLDEPTTALSSRETERLFALIRQLRSEGIALIYISHRMAEIDELADRVTVLRDGTYVGTLSGDEISSASIVKMMVGRDLSGFYVKTRNPDATFGPAVLEVENASDTAGRVKSCSLTIHEGEVLGLAGLVGAGRTELARLIFGADPLVNGTVKLNGNTLRLHSPREALAAGIAYLTEDRKALGLFLDMSCAGNINLGVLERDAHGAGVLDLKHGRHRATDAFKSLGVRAASTIVNVGGLSGGNQQKVLLGRLLETGPKVLILDEPTRGVDIGAKTEIYRIIGELAAKGLAILVISSEMPEIIGLSDRVLVMREGVITGEIGGPGQPDITQEAIMKYAAGLTAPELAA